MASWFLVPCLVHMRDEWNAISPKRDKGSDGSIGDTAHSSRTSDHNPRSNGAVLALDIDSTGPWPGGFDHYVQRVVARCRSGAEWRLEYVIWNHKIASRSDGWKWVTYTGSTDPHTGHAHFSARHDNTGQSDTRSWHIADEEDLPVDQKTFNALMDGWAATDNGKTALREAAGVGVYNQQVGHGPRTIGVVLDSVYRDLNTLTAPTPGTKPTA